MNCICPYCKDRLIALTLTDDSGTYSVCEVCSMAWGAKANAVTARCEVRVLEYWAGLPDARVAS